LEPLPDDDEHERRRRQSFVGLAVALVLVGAFILLLLAYKHSADELDCIAANHRNCTPPIDSSGH
jgi:hypothetical protein